MYLVFKSNNKKALANLSHAERLVLSLVYNSITVDDLSPGKNFKSSEEAEAVFDDIVEALESGEVDVYHVNEGPGHWKKEKETPKPPSKTQTPKK